MKLFSLLSTQYDRFSNTVKTYLSKTLESYDGNFGNNTIFGQLINVVGAVALNIMLYIEDALVEQNKYTALRKKSIYGLAALSGYEPSLGKAAGTWLKLNFKPTNSNNFNIILYNHTKLICTQNGLTYNLILPQEAIILSIDKDNSQKILYAILGKYESQSFISTGGKYYTLNFKYNGNIDLDYIEVKVNNELWTKASSLYDMTADGKLFVIKTAYSGGVDIIFGNDVHGRALKDGDNIYINYLTHDGESGNIDVNQETFFIFDNNLTNIAGDDIDGNTIFNITLASNDAITSGTNSETTELVKSMIGYNSRSLVLAAPENYKQFLNNFSFCGYNRTWSEPDSLEVNSLIMKNYKLLLKDGKDYFRLKESDFILSKMQKDSIINSIKTTGNQLAAVTYNILDPELCKYALYLYIKLKSKVYDVDYIKELIRTLIGEFFSNINNDIFIPKSDIIYLLKSNIEAIDGVSVYFLSEKNETALLTKSYNKITYKYNPSTGNYDKLIESIHLYDGENPNLGLDDHGNIYLASNHEFPILMGGWDFLNSENLEVKVIDPLIITFE